MKETKMLVEILLIIVLLVIILFNGWWICNSLIKMFSKVFNKILYLAKNDPILFIIVILIVITTVILFLVVSFFYAFSHGDVFMIG